MASYSITIGDVEREITLASLGIREAANRVPVLSAECLSSDGTFVPDMDDEIVITENGTRIFGGVIQAPELSGMGGPAVPGTSTRINALGFASYADRRYVDETLAAGTLKSQLTTLAAYLSDYGVSLDGSQVDGPDMDALEVSYRKLTDVLNDLSSLSAGVGGSPNAPYLWEIDHAKTLRMFQAGTRTAPVDIIEGEGTEIGDLVVSRSKQGYANRVLLRAAGTVTQADDTGEQGDHGLVETLVDTTATLSTDVAERAAAGILSQVAHDRIEVRYSTAALGLAPGQVQTVTSAKRDIDGSFLVTEVRTRQEPNGVGLIRQVTSVSDYTLRGSWQDIVVRWTAGVGGVGVVGSGGAGGFGGSVGGGVGGGGGGGSSVSCCARVKAGDLVFSGFGDAPIKFLSSSGIPLEGALHTPQLGTGGLNGMCAFPASGKVGINGANYGAPLFASSICYDSQFASVLGYQIDWSLNGMQPHFTADGTWYGIFNRFPTAGNAKVYKLVDGAVDTSWDLGDGLAFYSYFGMMPETIAYFAANTDTVKQRDLVGSSTSDFVVETGNKCRWIQVLPGGAVLVAWSPDSGASDFVRLYDPSGAALQTFTLSGVNASIIYLTPGRWNGSSFWVQYFTTSAPTYSGIRVEEISTGSVGAILTSFDPEDGTFEFDGPFCVLRAPLDYT